MDCLEWAGPCMYKTNLRRWARSGARKGERSSSSSEEMSVLWEKSQTWRWVVRMSRDSKPFFFTFATLCGVVPGVIGFFVMQLTNSRNEQLESHLRQTARPDALRMGQVNRERLAEFLGELQRKEDTNDRYVAALRGETLTRNPYQRIQPVMKPTEENSSKPPEVAAVKPPEVTSSKPSELTTAKPEKKN